MKNEKYVHVTKMCTAVFWEGLSNFTVLFEKEKLIFVIEGLHKMGVYDFLVSELKLCASFVIL